jgi:hypothetical protein
MRRRVSRRDLSSAGRLAWALTALHLWVPAVLADTADARCDIYPRGSDQASAVIPCTFSQRQGFVTIRRADGIVHDLRPEGDIVGNFLDEQGRRVFRQSGLGSDGLIWRLPDESIFLYWGTVGLPGNQPPDPNQPYTTEQYDAVTQLRCRRRADAEPQLCPAGILRMENRQASIVIRSPAGEEFTVNFMTDYVNATAGRDVEARLDGDTWQLIIDTRETYEVPVAAIEGG